MPGRASLGLRTALAVVFLIAFFALAIGAAVGLTFLGVKVFAFTRHVRGQGAALMVLAAIGCFVAAAVIVWSAIPRIDRFVPPGPEMAPADAPELFRHIEAVAAATGQTMPRHVYLVPAVNAFVTERGGIMGLGSRRVMGIGLALLPLLDVSELRGVIAHEFGHFHGGDTRLGPWIYKTRGAVERTIGNLVRAQLMTPDGELQIIGLLIAAVRKPFQWFGRLFMRVTQAICREQELSADALAAGIVGSQAMVRGLKRTHGGAKAYDSFVHRELVPVLAAGFVPPIADGFDRFLRAPSIGHEIDQAIAAEMKEGRGDPYDSHPPLADRVHALEALAPRPVDEDARPAGALFADLGALEARLAPFLVPRERGPGPRIGWDEVIAKVYVPHWREAARALAGMSLQQLPIDREQLRVLMRSGTGRAGRAADVELLRWAIEAYGACLAIALIDRGFRPSAEPGVEVTLARDGTVVAPFKQASSYLFHELPPDEWAAWLESTGLSSQ